MPGAAVLHRPAGPHAPTPRRWPARASARRTTCSSPRSAATARGEVGVVTSPGRLIRVAGGRPARRCRPRPTRRRWRAGTRVGVRRPGAGRDGGRPRLARPRRARAGARHRAGRGQAGGARLPGQPRRVRGHRPQGRRPVVGAVELDLRGPRPGLHHRRRPAAALPGLRRPPAGPSGGRHGGHQARRRREGDLVRRGRSGARVPRGDGRRLVHRAARHPDRRRPRSPTTPSIPPRAGPPAACAPSGSSRARTCCCSPGRARAPPRRSRPVGKPVPLPDELGRRDGSGVRLTHTIGAVGGALGGRFRRTRPRHRQAPRRQD